MTTVFVSCAAPCASGRLGTEKPVTPSYCARLAYRDILGCSLSDRPRRKDSPGLRESLPFVLGGLRSPCERVIPHGGSLTHPAVLPSPRPMPQTHTWQLLPQETGRRARKRWCGLGGTRRTAGQRPMRRGGCGEAGCGTGAGGGEPS